MGFSEKSLIDEIRKLYLDAKTLSFVKGNKTYYVYFRPSSLIVNAHFRVLITKNGKTALLVLPDDPNIVAKFLIDEGLDVNCIDNT
jgi:hypothetical protein